MRIRRYLHHVGLASLIEAVQEMAVATVKLVRVPSDYLNAIGFGPIDEFKCYLGLGFERYLIRDFRFFRSASSSAHSRGR